MISLRAALANIHNDRRWWQKVLIGGALQLTVVGYPWVAGLVIESLDNIRKGYPTPLPPWHDWSARYITGIFAALIDFVFFLLPLLISAVLLFCVAVGWLSIVGVALLLYELAMFAIGVAPVARLLYVEQGYAEEALSMLPLRAALRPGARRVYAQARLHSLPAYLPALLLLVLAWLAARSGISGAGLAVLLLLWLAASAQLYAHLVVVQLYGAAERVARYA
jgi:hypothetical protein